MYGVIRTIWCQCDGGAYGSRYIADMHRDMFPTTYPDTYCIEIWIGSDSLVADNTNSGMPKYPNA